MSSLLDPPRLHLVSLGCPKNLVDSEFLLGLMTEKGFKVVEDPGRADIIIINTCAFIKPAVEEAIATILELAEYKKNDAASRLVVLGCLPQRYPRELEALLPEVDLFWGAGGLDRLPAVIKNLMENETIGPVRRGQAASKDWLALPPGFVPTGAGPRLRTAPGHRAYLKIAEGCSNACSYCLIPKLRGPFRSRPMPVLLEEAARLAEDGVKELILVAQDTTAYGRDLKNINLALLLKKLTGLEGLSWLRIMYAYPSGLTDELLEVMAGEPRICPYLDLPLQHASRAILGKMRRGGPRNLLRLVARLRRRVPGLTLRTAFIVGFPGETDDHFNLLMDFVAAARFDHLGVFKYCPEEGTAAAGLPGQVPQRVKETRRRRLLARQRRISRQINKTLVGRTQSVMIEGLSPETDLLLTGRTQGQAPEIDGQVLITKGTARPGQIKTVLITKAYDYDLIGEIQDQRLT
ncbi:MAG: 30S ribosomal protein S12 methylthiotransferase RimO [Thermodesulfobacteriota bacterium]